MRTPLPLIVSASVLDVPGDQIWLGGGEPLLKLRVQLSQFMACFQKAWAPLPVTFADVIG